jgi:DNA-binding protein H-NS
MNKQKLISALQSRIAKRKESIKYFWKEYEKYKRLYTADRITAQELGYEQKVDKALLKILQSPFDAGYVVGYAKGNQDACKAVKLTLEACECQN